ncbi:MAG: DUF3783 domain-containing protein [Spirochaetaceae bacterium]
MEDRPKELDNKVIIMNGFTFEEIDKIMRAVKPLFGNPRDLIFAKTTAQSVEMKLKDLIVDMSEDHEYLKKNPPKIKKEGVTEENGGDTGTTGRGASNAGRSSSGDDTA